MPGQGPSYLGPFANSVLSDVPSNMDYSFRAGLFMGDYDVVAYPNFPQLQKHGSDDAVAMWTDARNGRGSGAPTSFQAGRNPACEQADMFLDFFDPLSERHERLGQRERGAAVPRHAVSRRRQRRTSRSALDVGEGRLRVALAVLTLARCPDSVCSSRRGRPRPCPAAGCMGDDGDERLRGRASSRTWCCWPRTSRARAGRASTGASRRGRDQPSGQRSDPARFGRIDGWKARYRRPGTRQTEGPLVVESRADVFEDADGATSEFDAYGSELQDAGTPLEELTDLGDRGFVATLAQGDVRFYLVAVDGTTTPSLRSM